MPSQQTNTSLQETQPLVSFIITYYNLPIQMLCECIDSILALSLRSEEREIIVIDDGSEVSPMNSLIQYGDDIIYVRQKNGGVSVARNAALQMARGKYIQLVDGDDCLIQQSYEHCLELIRQHDDLDVVLFDFSQSPDTGNTAWHDAPIQTGSELMHNQNIHGAAWCALFRQSVRSQLLFTPGIEYGEDEEFTPQLLLRAETVIKTDAQAYYYRPRHTSAIHRHDERSKQKRLDDTMAVILHLNKIADTMPLSDRKALQRRVAQLTMDHIYNTIVLTRSQKSLDEQLTMLHQQGLFPLPDRAYSVKYLWFRRMTNSTIGRKLLLYTLPLLKKER